MDYLPFGGLTPQELSCLIYDPFNEAAPLGIRTDFKQEDFAEDIDMFRFVKQFLLDIHAAQPLKLTQKGNLNRKFVHQLYDHRIITSEYIDSGRIKLLKEEDYYPIHFSHFITKMAGLTKKYSNKLSLTKKGEKLLTDDVAIYLELLTTYTTKFNWSYMTYDPENVAQLGWAFSMLNFIRYGNVERNIDFYVYKYLEVFEEMLQEFENVRYSTPIKELTDCFRRRFFERFCDLFGLAEMRIEGTDILTQQYFVKKTPLVDKIFVIKKNIGDFGMN